MVELERGKGRAAPSVERRGEQPMTTDSILNFIRINERIGTAGQPTADQLQAARDEGYDAIDCNLVRERGVAHIVERGVEHFGGDLLLR